MINNVLRTSHGTPSDINIASELAPNEFDTPIPPSPTKRRTISKMMFEAAPTSFRNGKCIHLVHLLNSSHLRMFSVIKTKIMRRIT